MAGIKLININKHYGSKKILKDFCTLINEGDFVLISGSTSSGKTTLLNIMAGLLKPNSGEIFIDSYDINHLHSKERRHFLERKIGVITQGAYLEPSMTVKSNILLAAKYSTDPSAPLKTRIEELAKILGIIELLPKKASTISGNEKVRVCLARALLLDPSFIFLDAPTDKLDGENAEKVLKILKLFQQSLGKTIVLASSDSRANPYATKYIELRK